MLQNIPQHKKLRSNSSKKMKTVSFEDSQDNDDEE